MDVIVSRCAGLDVHKNTVMACVRRPGPDGGRTSQVRRFRTFTGSLRELRDWLVAEGVTQIAMEATGVYWNRRSAVDGHMSGFWSVLCLVRGSRSC